MSNEHKPMDNKYYHRGSGEVVEPKMPEPERINFFSAEQELATGWDNHIASLPAIGSIDPSYPVGWVGDDVEMVWQFHGSSDLDWTNTTKECYEKMYEKRGITYLSFRILFLPVNKVKSESHVDLSGVDRQQSAAEIDRLRGEVRKLREGLVALIMPQHFIVNFPDKESQSRYNESVRNAKQLLTETEGYEQGLAK